MFTHSLGFFKPGVYGNSVILGALNMMIITRNRCPAFFLRLATRLGTCQEYNLQLKRAVVVLPTYSSFSPFS